MRYVKLLVFLFPPFFSLPFFKYFLSHELKKKYYLYHPIYFLELDKQKSLVYNNDCTVDWVWRTYGQEHEKEKDRSVNYSDSEAGNVRSEHSCGNDE